MQSLSVILMLNTAFGICLVFIEFRCRETGHEEIAIDFNSYLEGGIPCLSADYSSETSRCRSFLCIIPKMF